eukprot:17153-Heterococcus_DN1.PRE.2
MMQQAAPMAQQHEQQQQLQLNSLFLEAVKQVADSTVQTFERNAAYDKMIALAFQEGDLLPSEDECSAALPVVWSTLIDDCLTSPSLSCKAILWIGYYLAEAAPLLQMYELEDVFQVFAELMVKHGQDPDWLHVSVVVMQALIEMSISREQLARHASALAECIAEGLRAHNNMVRKLAARAANVLLQSIPQELLKLASSSAGPTEEAWDVLLLKACLDACPHVRGAAVTATIRAVPLLATNSATRDWVQQQLITAAPQPQQPATAAAAASESSTGTQQLRKSNTFDATLLCADSTVDQSRVAVAVWGCYMALAPADMLCDSSTKQAYASHIKDGITLTRHTDSSVRLAAAEASAMLTRYCIGAVELDQDQLTLAKFAIKLWK